MKIVLKTVIAVAAAAIALIPAIAVANAQGGSDGESVTSGNVTARLSWDNGDYGIHDASLTITRNGAVALQKRIPDVVCDGCTLPGGGADDVKIVDLNGDGEEEVVVTASTSGPHCCALMGVYQYQPLDGGYSEFMENWLSSGFNLDDLDRDGVPEIVSGDVRFEDLFTPHTASFPPPAVFMYLRQDDVPMLVDRTELYPSLIRSNAAEARRNFSRLQRGDPDGGGYVAAYVADQYLLDRGPAGLRELDKQIKRGILGRPAAARAYRSKLLRLLHKYGYR